jgi:transcriptional regulator with XRE-family HTH domain
MPQPDRRDLSIGQRIAAHRRRLGLTQDGLAMRLHRSKSWVTKIERGERPLDSVRTLLEVARALGVEVRELTGQPWFPEPGGPGHEALPAIRRALLALSPPPMGADADDGAPIGAGDLPAVERDVLAAGWLWQREPNCFSVVVPLLPGLIVKTRLLVEVTAGEEHRRACRAQALLGHLGQEVLARLGEPDLSWVAANQSIDAAEQVGDLALSGASAWRVCHAVLRVDDVDEVYTVATSAARELEPALDEPSGELLSVYGGLQLVGAVASARAGDRPAAQRMLGQARATAARLGSDRNDYWMSFGPTNVAMHDVAVLIESGDPKAAIRHGVTLDPSGLASLERQSTHHVQLAHAYTLQRKDSEAVRELLVAERLNPEGVHYNMLSHDFVRGMLRRERRRVTPGLRGLARRLNLLDW